MNVKRAFGLATAGAGLAIIGISGHEIVDAFAERDVFEINFEADAASVQAGEENQYRRKVAVNGVLGGMAVTAMGSAMVWNQREVFGDPEVPMLLDITVQEPEKV